MALTASHRGQIPPFIVMEMMRAAAEREAAGHEVLHLEVGQPVTAAPAGVRAAACAALDTETIGYTLALGHPALRTRIARHYQDRYGVAVTPDQVVVTTGSSAAFLLGFLAAFNPGDRVALAAPGYPAYRNILTALGVEPVLLPVGEQTRFQPTVALLDAMDPRPAGVIVASPSNPTGSMLPPGELAALARWCEQTGVRLISDEIYHGLTYGQQAETAAATPEAVVINSFSKYYSMTGWRLGWMVVPESLLRSVECLSQNFYISPPTLSQLAAVAAFDCLPELEENVARYRINRDILAAGLPAAGFTRVAPMDGAFFVYVDIRHTGLNSPEFCRRLLEETGIACTPGVDFDPLEGQHFVRLSYAGASSVMTGAMERLRLWSARF